MANRAERRRQLRIDKHKLGNGINVTNRDGEQIAALMRVLHSLVRTSILRMSVNPLMEWTYNHMKTTSRSFERAAEIDCRRGCYHCCQMWVDVSPAEIFYICSSLKGNMRKSAATAVETANKFTEKMSFEERAEFVSPCPLLVDQECSVYEVRPIACRAASSMDVEVCKRAYNLVSEEQIPQSYPYMMLGSGYRLALAGAIKKAGLIYRAVELNSGLNLAFSSSDTEKNWLDGEDVFADGLHAPINDILAQPVYQDIYKGAFSLY
ncbi:MAG: YkgJ family cysteine cluster protein [Parasphingopyxis sp.]|uniref:YkgJ family cysteine cluster protein n=1 Tax=Parasphingopyxis sp. TaxID=1920299 RepID=UPI003FA10B47